VTESKRTSLLLSTLRKAHPDWMVWKIPGQITGGLPDALVMGPKGHAWIEFKRCAVDVDPQRHLTALQSKTLAKLHDLGQVAYVCALHDNGEQSMWFYSAGHPIAEGKTAFQDEMEISC
jgi:hypothetical protein